MTFERANEVRLMQPSVLAFIGDAVFNLFVRERLINKQKGTSHRLHVIAIHYVKAASQAKISKVLMESFTEEEAQIFRRGRNTKSTTIPKNADVQDYRYATAFEALLGYLYLTRQKERLHQLMEQGAEIIEAPRTEIEHEKE